MIMIYDGVFFKDKRPLSRGRHKCNMQYPVAVIVLSLNTHRLTFLLHSDKYVNMKMYASRTAVNNSGGSKAFVAFREEFRSRLTLRRLMSYIYMEHPFLVFLDNTQRRSTVGRTPLDE